MSDTPLKNLVATLKNKLADQPEILSAVQTIGLNIEKTGMSLEDCALLARMTSEELARLSAEIPEISLYFKLKRTQYKSNLLAILNTQATEVKDVKIAMYLLETNFSEEYDPATKKAVAKKRAGEDGSDLEKLMKLVRGSAPHSPVNEAMTIVEPHSANGSDLSDVAKLVHE